MMSLRSVVVLVVLLAACKKAKSASPGGPGGGAGGGMPPMPVEVSAEIRDTVVEAIAATGQIEEMQSIQLQPEVAGRFEEDLVREDEFVTKEAALLRDD